MYIIGENIHIISPKVKKALKEKDAEFFKALAIKQVEHGAQAIDLNLGRQKRTWEEVFPWMTKTVQEVVDVPLVIDSTNLQGIEAALKVITKARPVINSASCEEERLEKVPLMAKKYDAQLVALTLEKKGIPVEADARVGLALEYLLPRAMEVGMAIPDLIIDPLVLTVAGTQEFVPECIEAVRTLKFAGDPPPSISVGLSNVSNSVPEPNRPLINRVYLAMLMGAGLEMMIADPLDEKQNEVIRIIEERDDSTAVGNLYLKLHDKVAAMDELSKDDVDMDDPEQVAIWKTVQILLNKVIYAASYLEN
ncbi:MAG: 5-methyltetrahydrofolate:corrinoid/iron-sulfur protein co-methyltransferase [Chloroflexi bacterium]|nr:5-methyltetrahydrofolate:corrinoid/iron-sulfur protein co-methyltransferase [Chloroflexota bacterium]